MPIPRYARLEMERRWLVDPERLPDLSRITCRLIEDRYLEGRLRLRTITHLATGERELKLGKKYERTDVLGGPITTIYLSEAEHAGLASLPGAPLVKRRYRLGDFNIDVFEAPHAGLMLTEVERETPEAALAVAPPPWAGREVTDDPDYWGWSLAQASLP